MKKFIIGLILLISSIGPLSAETITGSACYRFSDNESIAAARDIALSMAKRDALEGYSVFVDSKKTVENTVLKKDFTSISTAGQLKNLKVTAKSEDLQKREVCRTIKAEVVLKMTVAVASKIVGDLLRKSYKGKEIRKILAQKMPDPKKIDEAMVEAMRQRIKAARALGHEDEAIIDALIDRGWLISSSEAFTRAFPPSTYPTNFAVEHKYNLMWQKGNPKAMKWKESLNYCKNLSWANYSDWRLPSIKELFTIVDYSSHDPAVNKEKFSYIKSGDYYWSSTQRPAYENNDQALVFHFTYGEIVTYFQKSYNHLLCVRGGDEGTNQVSNYLTRKDGTVEQKTTGLIWQQENDNITRLWENALIYCNELKLGDHTDWRLPNIKELLSIVDYSVHNPSIDAKFFPGTRVTFFPGTSVISGMRYWTSIANQKYKNFNFIVNFRHGTIRTMEVGKHFTRCVRGGK